MATKIICDECGAENAGRVTLDLARSTPLTLPIGQPWKLDRDLCQKCFDKFLARIGALFEREPQ